MPAKPKCPQCGTPLPAGALAGLCPACLLKQGGGPDTAGPSDQPPFQPPPLVEVARLFPQLEILGLLGKGGMGAVYKARQPALDRVVALKILPARVATGPGFAERFNREARALARLSHPNIVAVHEFGQADGLHYFVMEFVDGVNLRQLERAGRLSPREALQIIPQICDALQYAHDEGVVHRDIKPENVLVDRKGRVKIADFGLAKILGAGLPDPHLTGEGEVMGTPHYMAPEQVERPLQVDHRADIYSLGVVFYEMLTGELPLGKFAPPSRKVQVDVRLDDVVLHALEKEPDRRYQHASEVKTDVETIASAQPPAEPATRVVPPAATPGGVPAVVAGPSRLSRTAILGTCWAPWFFLALLPALVPTVKVRVEAGATPPGPAWWQVLLAVVLLPVALTAPFGTTILGGVALTQIRRSAGRLYGLGLALFDVWLFPLLALDALVIWMLSLLIKAVARGTAWDSVAVIAVLGILTCAIVDTLLVVWAWRAAKRPVPGATHAEGKPPSDASRQSASPAPKPRGKATGPLLGALLLLPPVLLVWFVLTGHRAFGVDLDADVQFWLGVAGLPLSGGLGALLAWGAWMALPAPEAGPPGRAAAASPRWSWQAIVAAVLLGLSLPLGGGAAVMLQLIARDGSWNPAAGELVISLGLVGAAVLTAATGLLLGVTALRQMRRAATPLRGRPCALAAVWFWPVLAVAVGVLALTQAGVGALGQPRPASRAHAGSEDSRWTVDALPPVVVRTTPASGAHDVPPGLTELRVTFSKDMADGSWSWSSAWPDSMPEAVEGPRFESDRRTCVLTVKLEPGRTYAYWLNSEKFQNFRDSAGRAAVPYLLIFKTRAEAGRRF